ncbi:MAG TPA: GAF domain-containing protein [Longimicrobiales bacterium]|nr:GAF domain-containing protein [Trueperaceae bacterium]HKJ92896.1 GAF domain-containing protein [Longimicrobiales bacterium]
MSDEHERSLAWIDERIAGGHAFRELADAAVRHLRARHPHYDWVGIYMLEAASLRLWAWDGPAATEHVEIPLGRGICGYAATSGETINVPDVNQDDRYLQCFLGTRSELVVPIAQEDRVFGEVDIDSDRAGAFDGEDEAFVQAFCRRLGGVAARERLAWRVVT